MMYFDEVQLPKEISVNSSGGPSFSTEIITVNDGFERRNQNWSQGRIQYEISFGIRSAAVVAAAIKFFRAREGKIRGFRFQDPLDHTSNADGISTVTSLDQLIGTGDGSNQTFQLIKTYSNGVSTLARDIIKPVTSTVLIAVNDISLDSADYTVDYTTGIVILDSAPTSGLSVKAGFEFDVPVRFDTDESSFKLQYVNNAQFSFSVKEINPL